MVFYEKGCAFEPVLINLMDEMAKDEYKKTYPMGKVPFLRIEEKSRSVPESSIIIEYIDRHCPGGTKFPTIPIWRARCACATAFSIYT